MPVVSKAQSRFFRWAESHPGESGVKPDVSKEFVEATHGQRVRDLPEHVTPKAEGGSFTRPPFKW